MPFQAVSHAGDCSSVAERKKYQGVLKTRQHQKSAEAKTITITVSAIRRGRSSPDVLACGDEERVVGDSVATGVELTVGGCILPHCGCVPLTSVFGL